MSAARERFLAWITHQQVHHPGWVAALVLLVTVPAIWAASTLGLKTDFAELLPQNKPSVVEMHRVSQRLSSASTLTIVAEGQDSEALKRFVDQAAPKLRALGPQWVGSVDDGVHQTQAFLEENKFLYASYDDLKKLHDEVLERYDYEVGKASGTDLGLDDQEPEDQKLTVKSVRKRLDEAKDKAEKAKEKYPGGYYLGENGHLIVLMVRTPISGGSLEAAAQLRSRVDKIIAEVNPARLDPSIKVNFTGDFITSAEEYKTVKDDLASVGFWGVSMVLGVVLLFFLRLRTLLAMGLTIGVGLVWTFGVTALAIGYLNSSTGFLVSIIAGNGINFGIIFMARYMEARRLQKMSVEQAIRTAYSDTWLSTLAASSAAMVAYGSLAATDFRGFKHFGVIGGMGMLLCWLATYMTLPSILVVSERISPMFTDRTSWRAQAHGVYGYVFAWLVKFVSRPIVVLAVALGLVGCGLSIQYLRKDPMEYDLSKLSNERRGESSARNLSVRVDKIVGRLGQDGMAVMVDRLDQVVPLKAELERRKEAAPEDQKPFEKVVTLFDLLPERQQEKIQLVDEVLDRIHRAHEKHFLSDKDWAELAPEIPKKSLTPLTIADLPERMARPFTEIDGTRGRIVYIAPKEGRSIWDAHYLDIWASSFRTVTLPNGEVIKGSGRAVIYSDMIHAVSEDAPKAIAISLLGTILVVLLAFRFRRASWAVMSSILLGVSWLVAYMYLKDIKINFLNFVALPITFGIAADYGLNMVRRFHLEAPEDFFQVMVETGGAVVLCSLTTVVGYLALLFSLNRAIRSFGTVAAVGELTTLLTAVLVLPAAIRWHQARGGRAPAERASKPTASKEPADVSRA